MDKPNFIQPLKTISHFGVHHHITQKLIVYLVNNEQDLE